MNKKLLAISSLGAFAIAACESTGTVSTPLAETYRLHTADGVIETNDPVIIAKYKSQPAIMIALHHDAPVMTAAAQAKTISTTAP